MNFCFVIKSTFSIIFSFPFFFLFLFGWGLFVLFFPFFNSSF